MEGELMNWPKLIRAILDKPEPTPRDFKTYAELKKWFDDHLAVSLPPPNLCDDYSREARALATADGYYLSNCLVAAGRVYQSDVFFETDNVIPSQINHIANLAIVEADENGLSGCYYVDLNWKKLIKLCNFYPGGKYVSMKNEGGNI
jgi:hypothetical protein